MAEQSKAAEAKAAEVARLQATIEGLEAAATNSSDAVAAAEAKLAQVGLEEERRWRCTGSLCSGADARPAACAACAVQPSFATCLCRSPLDVFLT